MEFPLLKCNNLVRTDSSVWTVDPKASFDYSDGETAEEYLNDVIMNAQDLTSQSVELDEKIIDWPSEYHLSSKRANLLRGLKLEGIKNVLELGSGCGSITRYLGELRINIDAVEGNFKRAEINSLRCRDLENVNVIKANFNELIFPKKAYDAVFLIGVLEYAKKFSPNAVSDKNAVINILTNVKSALKKDGVLFIAIENRMGLKYWMGASEDHYGQPYVGLYGYPQSQGVRTYDKREWEYILDYADFKCYRFIYPFPDYKLPIVLLSDTFIKNDNCAYSNLFRILSRDYTKPWRPNADEFLIWKSLQQSYYLEDFANSFFIIISDSMERLTNVIPYDFVHFSDSIRKPAYRTVTIKPVGESYVRKERMVSTERESNAQFIKQNLKQAKYIKGHLLSTVWIETLVGSNDNRPFEILIQEYYRFLIQYFHKQELSHDAFDLLPFNIILDNDGSYRIIDKEWIITSRISPEYVLFRAILWFSCLCKESLIRIYKTKNIINMREFVEYVFNLLSLRLDQELDKFVEFEWQVQTELTCLKEPNIITTMLSESFQDTPLDLQTETVSAQLFWAGENEYFCEENSVSLSTPLGSNRQVLIFKLPRSAINVCRLRLDPSNRPGIFDLFNILLKYSDPKGKQEKLLWQIQSGREIAKYSQREDVYYCNANSGETFLSLSNDPQIVFELPMKVKADKMEKILQFEVEMCWYKSKNYSIAGKNIRERNSYAVAADTL